MSTILLLFLVGVALLAADVFVSSFLLAVLGGFVMLAGCGVAYQDFGALGALLGAGVALILLGGTVYAELVLLPKTRFGRGLVVHSTSGAESQPPVASNDVIGKTAVALTTLAPSGYVLVEDRRYEAFCRSGHVPKGTSLRVLGLDNFRLIVSKTD
jgi:membrane-bound serine protease (ClpP class)